MLYSRFRFSSFQGAQAQVFVKKCLDLVLTSCGLRIKWPEAADRNVLIVFR